MREKPNRNTACISWIKTTLAGGPKICDYVRIEGREKGFTQGQMAAARRALGVVTFHQFDEDGGTQNWFWSLPDA